MAQLGSVALVLIGLFVGERHHDRHKFAFVAVPDLERCLKFA